MKKLLLIIALPLIFAACAAPNKAAVDSLFFTQKTAVRAATYMKRGCELNKFTPEICHRAELAYGAYLDAEDTAYNAIVAAQYVRTHGTAEDAEEAEAAMAGAAEAMSRAAGDVVELYMSITAALGSYSVQGVK